jgi:preprotein translocase subunit SecD
VAYRWRIITSTIVIGFCALLLLPTAGVKMPGWWEAALPHDPIHLGLDLQGGIHMVLEVQAERAVENSVDLMMEQLRSELREKEIATREWHREGQATMRFEVVSRSRDDELKQYLADTYGNIEPVGAEQGNLRRYKLVDQEIENIRELAIDQAVETIRNRVDEFGVSEPTITRTGSSGILIQLPGVDDADRAKRLIGRTAQLQFKLVSEDPSAPGLETLTGTETDPVTRNPYQVSYAVEPTVLMSGEVISDARHRPGQFGEAPFVSITLNSRGARIFERVTSENTGRRMAIVLDGNVQSAPSIRERIGGGRAVITGNFSLDEARDLAIVLRAGALPAPVVIAEERTVGPSLGRDSIQAGTRSFVLGGVLVIIFMAIYYRGAGLIADTALILNVLLLLAVLAAFEGTLTLPGIAGIVLTLGMAVDANVLVNERIREELSLGQAPSAAIDSGYNRAIPAILDSNVTTFLAGLILFQFGSGPIRGFALTLCIGIASTLFSTVFFARLLHDLSAAGRGADGISI